MASEKQAKMIAARMRAAGMKIPEFKDLLALENGAVDKMLESIQTFQLEKEITKEEGPDVPKLDRIRLGLAFKLVVQDIGIYQYIHEPDAKLLVVVLYERMKTIEEGFPWEGEEWRAVERR